MMDHSDEHAAPPARLTAALADRYRIEREIGAGGMATVYLAYDLKHERQVAIKVMRGGSTTSDDADRFLREIRIVAKLNHQSILPLFDSGAFDDLLYFVMPFVEGPTLWDRIKNDGPLTIDDALHMARQIADGLQYAHDQGVIHRDIKPANILLRRDHPLIADFGIGKSFVGAATDDRTLTMTGMSMGTPTYMSPEQAITGSVVDQRTDVYSLGCLLFEMLAGRPPFTAPNAYAVIARHTSEKRPSVRAVRKDVPSHVDDAIRKAMAVDVGERFTSCADFAAALEGASPTSRRRAPRIVLGGAVAAISMVAALYVASRVSGTSRAGAAQTFVDNPPPSAWVRKTGESYAIVATSDSLLVVHRSRASSAFTFDGAGWTRWTVPDSFELRPYAGALYGRRLLATRRSEDAGGAEQVQLWWLTFSQSGLRPSEPVTEPEPDVPQPYWWSDGRATVTWLETIKRKTPQGWVAEPTGAQGAVITMWGDDASHRFAVAEAPSDSLLVNDGIGWQRQDILSDRSGGRPSYAGGVLLGDGTSVVFGEQCVNDSRCSPLVVQEQRAGGRWVPVVIPRGVGLPSSQARRPDAGCVNRFDFLGAAGRSADDYYVWGQWTFCRSQGARLEEDAGCPSGQPCVWHVAAGDVQPSPKLVGRVIEGLAILRGAYHAMLEDGTLWKDTAGGWRPVNQLPDLPPRFVDAGAKVVLMSKGARITYQRPAGARSRLVVSPLLGTPASVSDSMPPRRLVVRDTTVVMVTGSGTVFVAGCREGADAKAVTENVQCGPWRALGSTAEPVLDAEILEDGAVIAIGRRGFAAVWRGGAWRREPLPLAARTDSLWSVRVSVAGDVIAVGTGVVMTRNRQGQWSIGGQHAIGFDTRRTVVVLPEGGFAVGDGRIRAWESTAIASPAIELHRRIRGEGQVSVLHAMTDGRLVAGFENADEPGVGGWLQVWRPPLRANKWQRVDLPMNVDVTDLSDDGTLLYVVGRGGSMAIRLDALPFASVAGSLTGRGERPKTTLRPR